MGIHHVTAIAREPQRNLDFYAGTLGMRLVKLTVNYDDPGTYHFYYGDALGRPGSLLTFFPWTGGRPGRQGTGQINGVGLAVPSSSLGYWIERLISQGVKYDGPTRRFDEPVLAFADPDGLMIELIATARVDRIEGWSDGPVPAQHAVRGVHAVTIWEDGDAGSAAFLTGTMGFRATAEEENRLRFESGQEGLGTVVELRRAPGFWRGTDGVGTVHHVAFRATDDAEQRRRQDEIRGLDVGVTDVRDRTYFRSIYFREPGGVLFEIATDGPGFLLDETAAELGTTLKLPPQYESMRGRLEKALPPLRLPHAEAMES
ncbi:MAG TPA: ring-cleaving dioxygenase [Gemmatimonadales bacterium]|jgi:catechol 2,3-dioxygenase-like lactoylglutathione lyase family enzyme|nr:ring-cleaving dioxygenase [Gemmatimonadales bacterium]